MGLLASACGNDNKGAAPSDPSDGGAPSVGLPAPVAPALTAEDCAASTSELTLTQPEGAAVWGGLVLLEFEVEGAKVDSFDVQLYDAALGGWTTTFVSSSAAGQRDDGSYFLAVTTPFNEVTKDLESKVRVRPAQAGCPDAEWTESEPFTAGDPLADTSWSASIPRALFNGQLNVQRYAIPDGSSLPPVALHVDEATLSVAFDDNGEISHTVSLSLETEPDAAYHDCTVTLTFGGTYELLFRPQYGGVVLAVSDMPLTSVEDTTCELPSVEQMATSLAAFNVQLPARTHGLGISYLPTLYLEPGAPVWNAGNFSQVFEMLGAFLEYTTDEEQGSVTGYLYPLELSLTQD